MVQLASLEDEDYCTPLSTLSEVLLDPEKQTHFTPDKLHALLKYHLGKLKSPSSPYLPPSESSRQAIQAATASVRGTSWSINVDERSRELANQLARRAQIDEIEALLLIKSCGDENASLDQLTLWYTEEVLAVPKMVMALQRLATGRSEGEWTGIAAELLAQIIFDDVQYIEQLFRAWSEAAQRQLQGSQRSEEALFWARSQLRLQNELLDLLFLVVYDFPDRPASISQGLLNGVIASAFGTIQANREIWNSDAEAQKLQQRIRDLTLVIALEALCLSAIVTPSTSDDLMTEEQHQGTVLKSRDAIGTLDRLIFAESSDLARRSPEPGLDTVNLPVWPMPVICLAWSIVLRSLPSELQPASFGYSESSSNYEEFARRAIRLPSGLFPWLEEVLTGPLLGERDSEDETRLSKEMTTWQRKVVKDLLLGLSDLVRLDDIVDRAGLYRVWDLLFGGGSPSSSLAICEDYWVADFPFADRSAIVDAAQFPYDAVQLPLLLTSLSGAQPSSAQSQAGCGTSPAASVFDYVANMPTLTIRMDPSLCSFSGKHRDDFQIVHAKKDVVLPGVLKIRSGASGEVISPEDSKDLVVRWKGPFAVWGLLVEIIRTASGCRHPSARDGENYPDANLIHLSIADLDIRTSSDSTLSACLELLRVMLHPVLGLTQYTVSQIRLGDQSPQVHILEAALAILDTRRGHDLSFESQKVAKSALDIIQSLLSDGDPSVWSALHHSTFFGALGKRRSIAADIIDQDSIRGDHTLTQGFLQLVTSLAESTSSTVQPDDVVVKAALQLVVSSIWLPSSGWRFKSTAARYKIISQSVAIFSIILRHPSVSNSSRPSQAAQYLIDSFVTSSSLLTYRPLLEVFAQAPTLATKLISTYRTSDAKSVVQTIDASLAFLAAALRVSANITSDGPSLPKALFAAPVTSTSGDKLQAVEIIMDLATSPLLPDSTRLQALTTLRTYLLSTRDDDKRPSLASLLRNAKSSFATLADLAKGDQLEIRAGVWEFLASTLDTQPGCAIFCAGADSESLEPPLATAVDQIIRTNASPHTSPNIAATLSYCNAILACPGATRAVNALRSNSDFWTAVSDIATRIISPPPTFTLSMHSDQFASRIQSYAYSVQGKASTTSLLAAELAASLDMDEDAPETAAQGLVLGLFRHTAALTEMALSATHSSCIPELHESQDKILTAAGINLLSLKTMSLLSERPYGSTYLYDGEARISNGDAVQQSRVNLAIDMLNLNWSMLEADVALTRAFSQLADTVHAWTEGDALAAAACLKAGAAVAEQAAEEERGGDVMLTIQCERLAGLSRLLETALGGDTEPDGRILVSVVKSTEAILESQMFPPMTGLRNTALPAIHKPLLGMVHSIVQALPAIQSAPLIVEAIVEAAISFTLDAADIVLDQLIRERKGDSSLSSDLEQIVGIICAITRSPFTTIWLDKVSEHSLIPRSLELISRLQITNDYVQPHVASILLLHLALASNPLSAEKLALFNPLTTYADNSIALLAEQAQIAPTSPSPQVNSVHGAWCSMLWVVHAILSSLPENIAGTFTRSDVIPFFRVCTTQILRSLSWNGETPLSMPLMEELSQVTNVIYSIVQIIGPDHDLLAELSIPILTFLKNVRFALAHPRLLSTLMIPASEEERVALEAEMSSIGDNQEPQLVDFSKAPILAGRTVRLLGAARSSILTLMALTQAWTTLQSDAEEMQEDNVLYFEYDALTAAEDPVGVLNDVYTQTTSIINGLPLSSTDPDVLGARTVLSQLQESSVLLATSQIILRQGEQPETRSKADDMEMDPNSSFELKGTRRRMSTTNIAPGDRAGHVLNELTRDLEGILTGLEDQSGVMGWLCGVAEKRLIRRQ